MNFFEWFGRAAVDRVRYVGGLSIQIGKGLKRVHKTNPITGRRRWKEAVYQMAVVGVEALPVVCLIAFATGMIMALTGGNELRKFGALEFVISLVGISMTRELGPLMTAICVIGRSGSAFSAEIGTMVVTEEVDALRSMALDPLEFLLVPKMVAMLVMLPCLTIAADFSGICAGGVYVFYSLDMPFPMYIRAVLEALYLRDIITGLIKSLAFGTIIVHVGCYEGFTVRGGPIGVGRSTTAAVVKSIFLIVLADLIFTAFFYFFLP